MKNLLIIFIVLIFCSNIYSNEKTNKNFENKFSFIYTSNDNNKSSVNDKNYGPFLMFGIPGITGGLSLTSAIILTVFYNTKYMSDGILAGMIVSWVIFGLASLVIIIEALIIFIFFYSIIKSIDDLTSKNNNIYIGNDYLGIKIKIPSSRNNHLIRNY